MSRKYTYDEVKDFVENLGYELISKKYIDAKQKLILKDKKGYYYFCNYNDIMKNKSSNKFHKHNPYTIQNIKLWCKLNNKPFELLSDTYEGNAKLLKWKCLKKECSEEFTTSWSDILQNRGCSYCAGRKVGLSNCLATKNPQLAAEWHSTLNGDLTPYDVVCNSHKKVWWQCKENHNHQWKTSVLSRNNNGNGCPYCSGRYPTKENNLLIVNPKLVSEWNYDKNYNKPEEYCPNSGESVWWKCKKCGYEWKAVIANRSNGTGCPKCAESKGEKKIREICKLLNISHDSQYIFNDLVSDLGNPLRFDVPIFLDKEKTKLRMLVEFDGKQHFEWNQGWMTKKEFETLQYHDKLKNEYCKNNNIKLLRISYYEFDNIEQILNKELINE